jgi:1-aminocyclopropane-1-carboxylate deaminase/D-cysteine desulfhydrase-like pyridoxal-dependent ACC family enzyme
VSANERPAPVVLGSWPTPLEPAPRLAAATGLAGDALWLKRDDLSGLGGGGNKVRKLQYTCAQALAAGATTLITSGAPQSNHARLTAAAAARLGLTSVLVLQGEEPEAPAGNLVLDLLAGARLVWTGPATAEQTRREVQRQAAQEAMRLAARTEGIFLDPTYTARALAGLIARVAGGDIKREDRTVLMHTGGLPGLFGHPELPRLAVP